MEKITSIEFLIVSILDVKKFINQHDLINIIQEKLLSQNSKVSKSKIQNILSKNIDIRWYTYRYHNNSIYYSLSKEYESKKVKKINSSIDNWIKENKLQILASMHLCFGYRNVLLRSVFEEKAIMVLQKIFKKKISKSTVKKIILHFNHVGWYIQKKKRKESEIIAFEFESIIDLFADTSSAQKEFIDRYYEYQESANTILPSLNAPI